MNDNIKHRPEWYLALSLIGLGVSVVLLYHFVLMATGLQLGPSFCSINDYFNCDKTNQSAYSVFLRMPLASWGMFFYLFLAGFSAFCLVKKMPPYRYFLQVVLAVSTLATAFSIYLLCISEFVIGAICPLCLGLYVINASLLALSYSQTKNSSKFISSFNAGILLLLRSPFLLLPAVERKTRNAAYVGLGILLLVVGLVIYSPQFIYKNFMPDPALVASVKAKEAFPTWLASPAIQISIDGSGGVFADYSKGPASAPIQLVEFADFECPMCRRTFPVIEDILHQYGDKIHFTFMHFPLDHTCNPTIHGQFHYNACYAARFTRCAGEQGKYWEAVSFVFTLPAFEESKEPAWVRDAITAGAKSLGLDEVGMTDCMRDPRQERPILRNINEGSKAQIQGTPSIFINGKLVPMASKQFLTMAIDHLLAKPQ